MEFRTNQIFEHDYPIEAAVWCDENGASMVEMPVEDGIRRFQIVANPKPTPEELAEQVLEQAKSERAKAVASITVEVDGMIFDGDEKAQERMARAVTLADSPEETTEWVLHDNTVAIVTAEQLRKACKLAGKAQTALWTKPYTDTVTVTETNTHYTLE